jgi:hypothetical protein
MVSWVDAKVTEKHAVSIFMGSSDKAEKWRTCIRFEKG